MKKATRFRERSQRPSEKREKKAVVLFTHNPWVEARRKPFCHGWQKNYSLWQRFIEHTLQVVQQAGQKVDFDVFISTDGAGRPWSHRVASFPGSRPIQMLNQKGVNFDARFRHMLEQIRQRGYRQILVLGNDCPDLTPALLQQAFHLLHRTPVVISPASDGGINLLAVHNLHPEVFQGLPWCGATLYKALLLRLTQQGLAWSQLPVLPDLDSRGDLFHWLNRPQQTHWLFLYLQDLFAPEKLSFPMATLPSHSLSQEMPLRWQLPPP